MTDPVLVAGHGLAVDQAAAHLEPVDRLDDRWIAQRPGQQTYADRVVADHQAEAIVLDLVHPARAGRWALGGGWKARFDEAGGTQTLEHGGGDIRQTGVGSESGVCAPQESTLGLLVRHQTSKFAERRVTPVREIDCALAGGEA
jgi:hypothetical protein